MFRQKCHIKCILPLPEEIQIFLKRKLNNPYFTRLRSSVPHQADVRINDEILSLFSVFSLCPFEDTPYLVGAIGILSGLPIDFILEKVDLIIDYRSYIILKALAEETATMFSSPIFTYNNRIESTPAREQIPTTYNWFVPGNPFNDMPPESEEFVQSCLNAPDDVKVYPAFRVEDDISEGYNPSHGIVPAMCMNDVDDQWPPPMNWIADLEMPDMIDKHCIGCHCGGGSCNTCHKMKLDNGSDTMCYDENGKIQLEDLNHCKPLVIECNSACRCDPSECKNRVVQNRSKYKLFIYRTISKGGWGTRTLEFIPRGSFVCEYLGQVITDPKLAEYKGLQYDKTGESYLFDMDAYDVDDDVMLTVDPRNTGNISRFINHSCDPNLIQISIGPVESHLFHRIVFFSGRDIYPHEDVSFHYNYELDSDPEKIIVCNCGSLFCRVRLR